MFNGGGSMADVDLLHDFASTLPTLEGIVDDNAWSDWMNLDSPRLAEAVQPRSPPPAGAVLWPGAGSLLASCAQQKRVQPVCPSDPLDPFAACFLLDPASPDCFEQAATISTIEPVLVPCTPVKRSRSEMLASDLPSMATTTTPSRAVRTPQRASRAASAAQRGKTSSPKPPTTPKSVPRGGGARARSGSLRPTSSNVANHVDTAPAITLLPQAVKTAPSSMLVRSHSVPCKLSTESPFSKPIPIFGGLFKQDPCFDEGDCAHGSALDELNEQLQKVASPGLLPKQMLANTLSAPLPVLLTTAPKARPPVSPLLRRVQ